jgi:hypothetical protein
MGTFSHQGSGTAREEEVLFFEKKNQKTFVCWVPRKLDHDYVR